MKRLVLRISKRTGHDGWWTSHGAMLVRRPTQESALTFARWVAKSQEGSGGTAQIVVHGADGRIRFERTYGNDPRRTKG